MLEQRVSDDDRSKRDIPSFIEPRPPLIQNPFMRPRPQKGTNLLELFEEDSVIDEPELVQVYLRMKPCDIRSNLYEVRSDKCLVTSLDTTTAGHGRRTQHNVSRMYTFSKIFGPQCTQKEIFEQVVKENLKKLPNGHNFTLLTYGASGSGKTYTLMGTVNAPGLVPRSLEYVFKLVDAAQTPVFKPSDVGADRLSYEKQEYELQWVKKLRHVSAPLKDKYRRMSAQLHNDLTDSNFDLSNRTKHYVWVSFLEIYNEAIYDLLAPPDKRTKLRIREDSSGNVYVKDAIQAFVRSGEEAYDVMVAGKLNLVVAATGVHAHSSRSHCIFTITMLTESEGGLRTSCVRLCDLAGCERARATRNTGARMAESRAINSSLHVLERCLHTLRRKQRSAAAIVPYRESKLTRLLGSGLSGSRGEAVSMVVTLNPAPAFAHETKHVLSLAAVAQDIQINNTMFASTLESSDTQDTTIGSSAEIMKLRSDNELLHFELIQAQARNKELLAAMEEKQEEAANTMRELVEEAKDMTRQYYEAQIEALRSEMDDMIEEYESRLAKKSAPAPLPASVGTPTRYLQTKVAQLMTQIAVLEDKLAEERLARDRAEKELEHLRTCLDERDEKAFKDTDEQNQDEVVLTDSEDESSDPFNESLEPVFKKTLNRSHLHDKVDENEIFDEIDNNSQISNNESRKFDETDSDSRHEVDERDNNLKDSECEKSSDTVKFEDCDTTPKNSTYMADDEIEISNKIDTQNSIKLNDPKISKVDTTDNDLSIDDNIDTKDQTIDSKLESYETIDESKYTNATYNESITDNKTRIARGTYFVKDSLNIYTKSIDDSIERDKDNLVEEMSVNTDSKTEDTPEKLEIKDSETLVSKILRSLKSKDTSDNSLRQFEQLEEASRDCDDNSGDKNDNFGDVKITKNKRYFDESIKGTATNCCLDESDSDCIIKKALEKNLIDTKNIKPTKSIKEDNKTPDDDTNLIPLNVLAEKRTYFDNIDTNSDPIPTKTINNLKIEAKSNERSPSIVKDDIDKDYEPVTIKKLIRESFKSDVQKVQKKHESIDLFESPHLPNIQKENDTKEVCPKSTQIIDTEVDPLVKRLNDLTKVEVVRKSIERLVLEQKNRNEQDAKTDASPVEKTDAANQETKLQATCSIEIIEDKTIQSLTVNSEQTLNDTQNTTTEFENLCKDLSKQRATEFELLLNQDTDTSQGKDEFKEPNTNKNKNGESKRSEETNNTSKTEEIKYNLRNKSTKPDSKPKVEFIEEILAQSGSKTEIKAPKNSKRSLRLRRRKNQDDDNSDPDQDIKSDKLKDLMNLKKEFSDVTMGLPATNKEVKDIPSPEKRSDEEENLPPMMGIQSCPSKSVTRSRRKLFTPRAEPLEESFSQAGDSNERIYVPRPSYHRARARRKL